MNIPPIFCISLARDTERREQISSRLDSLGAKYEIVDAIDGHNLDLSALGNRLRQDKMRRKKARVIMPAEVGCYLSHYNLWKRIAAENIPAAVIVEDDAVFSAVFPRIVAAAANIPYEWDAIHLAVRNKIKPESTLCKIDDSYSVCRPKTRMISMCGYAVSLAFAKKALRKYYEIDDAVDWKFWEYWNNSAKMYAVFPRIIDNDNSPSNIAHSKKAARKGRTISQWFHSKIWKLCEVVKCRLYNWRHPISINTKGNVR